MGLLTSFGWIGLPRRSPTTPDIRPPKYFPRDGQNGTIALPARAMVVTGEVPAPHPGPIDPALSGQYGIARYYSERYLGNAPVGGENGVRNVLPSRTTFHYGNAYYSRQFYANTAGLEGFKPQNQGMDWTTNTVRMATTPASPIPYSNKWRAQTFYKPFNPRIHNMYGREVIKPSTYPNRYKALRDSGRYMRGYRQQRLTRWTLAPAYGQLTLYQGE